MTNESSSNNSVGYNPPKGSTARIDWASRDGKSEEIEVIAEWIVLRKKEKPSAEIFNTYYRLVQPQNSKNGIRRAITFVLNGGPGAASAYLHLGGLGPQRVCFNKDGSKLPPPAKLTNNTESWIEFTDLVFIDPVGTGFSRVVESDALAPASVSAAQKDTSDKSKVTDEKEYYGLNRDLESLGEFIERFLSKYKLWDVPVYIAGESYGGFRTAKLARRLQEKHGIGLSAVIAISPALEWALLNDGDYDVLRSVDTFCSMALGAAFHGRSRVFKKGDSIEKMRPTIESFATKELAHALMVGTAHEPAELEKVFCKTADFLGLPEQMVKRAHGRIPFWRFSRELLRDQQRIVSWYDATLTTIDPYPDREMNEAPDPSLVGDEHIFESGINQLLRARIGVETERRYESLNLEVYTVWKRDDSKHAFDGPAGSVDDLRYAMSLNPEMKVLIVHGYYDMITPYFSSERLVEQMKLLPESRRNLTLKYFSGGHMFYTWEESRIAFRDYCRNYYE